MKMFKKIIAFTLATIMLMGTVSAYADNTDPSPSVAPIAETQYVKQTGVEAKTGNVKSLVETRKNGNAAILKVLKTTKKSISIYANVEVNNVKYTVMKLSNSCLKNCSKAETLTIPKTTTYIGYKAFAKAPTLTKIKVPCKKAPAVAKNAFKGCDTTKITIVITKMSNKQIKAFKKSLSNAGFKGTIEIAK